MRRFQLYIYIPRGLARHSCTCEDAFAVFLGSQMVSCLDASCISSHPKGNRRAAGAFRADGTTVYIHISAHWRSPRRSGPQKVMGDHKQLLLLQIIVRNPGIYLHEIQERLYERLGETVSSSTLCRTLQSMGCMRQVIHHVAMQRDDELRARFMARITMYEPSMFLGWTRVALMDAIASGSTATV